MMSLIARFAAILAAGSAAIAGTALPARADDAAATGGKWDAWTELGGYGSNRSEANRGEIALWAPLMQTGRTVLFTDMRGKLFEDDAREGNAALGYRFMSASGWNPGFWIGFDRRHTEFGTDFDQVSLGAELLSADWDLRANVYLPLNDSELVSGSSANATVEVIGSGIFLVPGGLEELALHGFDAEIGYRIPLERLGWDERQGASFKDGTPMPDARHHDLRVFVGGYYFDHDDFDGEVAGARVRGEWRIENVIEAWEGSRLTFEAAYQYDDVREDQFEAGLRLRIPLGHRSEGTAYALSPQEKRMSEGIRRDTDVVSISQTPGEGGGGTPERVEDALSGVDLNKVVMVANGTDLNAALSNAGGNSLIVAFGGSTSYGYVTMHANQTLLGGGGALQVRGLTTGTLATYYAPGTRPTLGGAVGAAPPHRPRNGADGPVVLVANNTHVSGVNIDGGGGDAYGVRADVPDGANSPVPALPTTVFITNSQIQGAYIGIVVAEGGSMTVRNTTIADSDLHGIVVGTNASLDIRDSTIRNAFGHGIMVSSLGTANLTVANTRFEGNFDGAALYFDQGAVTVTSSTGNVDAMTAGVRCMRDNGTFTGSVGFSDNTVVTNANCQIAP